MCVVEAAGRKVRRLW